MGSQSLATPPVAVEAVSIAAPAAALPEDERVVYQEIVENARVATNARIVQMHRFDAASRYVTTVATAGLESHLVQAALDRVAPIVPDFDPRRVMLPADANHWSALVFLEGECASAPFGEVVRGVLDPSIVQLANTIVGIQHSFVCPLKVQGEVLGALAFHAAAQFDDARRHTAEAFARQASLTLENSRLLITLRERVEELQHSRWQITVAEERLRQEIAEMLHSRVQGRMLIAWHRLGRAERLFDTDPAQARALVHEVREEIDQIREREVRQASHLLHPSIIKVGMVPAIRSLIGRFEDYFRVSLEIDAAVAQLDEPTQNRIPEPVRLAIYRVVEEALNNTNRHARARLVEISIALDPDRFLSLVVTDDGQGFHIASTRPGLGLSSIDGRVEQFSGSWNLISTPGRGTRLSVRLPLSPRMPS